MSPSSSESSFDPIMEDNRDLESSFYFIDCNFANELPCVFESEHVSSAESRDSDVEDVEEMLEESSSSDDSCSLMEEIWENDSGESDHESNPQNLILSVVFVFFFLNYFIEFQKELC